MIVFRGDEESLIEELRGWLTVNCGEIIKVKKPRKNKSPMPGKFPVINN